MTHDFYLVCKKVLNKLGVSPPLILALGVHKLRALKSDDYSFAGEFKELNELTNQLGLKTGYAVDIAASDGLNQSSTYGFFKKHWAGLAIEMDPIKFSKLSYLYAEFENIRLARIRVTPQNISSLLIAYEIQKNFTLLNLDIDSYDLRVVEEILNCGFAPQIISMEINEKIPSGVFFTVEYDNDHYWQGDHFFGCSIDAAFMTLVKFNYVLYKLEWNNAIFISPELASQHNISSLEPAQAYNSGYKMRNNRKNIFPWNHDVENWLNLSPEHAASAITKYFAKYEGKFTCIATKDL